MIGFGRQTENNTCNWERNQGTGHTHNNEIAILAHTHLEVVVDITSPVASNTHVKVDVLVVGSGRDRERMPLKLRHNRQLHTNRRLPSHPRSRA